MKKTILILTLCLPLSSWAGVYKCTGEDGHTDYQATACEDAHKAMKIDTRTGGQLDLEAIEQQKIEANEKQKQMALQQQAEAQAQQEAIARRKQQVREQQQITQELLKTHSDQFSAFAIPPYDPDKLPKEILPLQTRLVEIEIFRRKAAQKALATGLCQRVEIDELHTKSRLEQLVFAISCSSGKNFYFNESELTE